MSPLHFYISLEGHPPFQLCTHHCYGHCHPGAQHCSRRSLCEEVCLWWKVSLLSLSVSWLFILLHNLKSDKDRQKISNTVEYREWQIAQKARLKPGCSL